MLIEKRGFTGGMNGDINARELPPNVMLNLMNASVGISQYGRSLRVENRPGTTPITQSVRPPYGIDQTIGSCIDEARNRVIYFNYNSVSYHGIYCYDIASGITYAVLYDSQVTGGLNFSKTSRIDRNCKVVGDLLYWTDNLNPPRRINIEAGIKMNHGSYSTTVTPYTYPMSQSVISWIRRPYGLPVTATKDTVGGLTTNFISTFSGQFASKLIYRDGEHSVVSIPSEMINYNLPADTYNEINVEFPLTETFDQDVQIIQLLVRYNNSPDYFVAREWNKSNSSDLILINLHNNGTTKLGYHFYNNKNGVAVGKADSVKPFDSIGLTVKTIEFATNRMFHGNSVKGYNTPVTTSLAAALYTNVTDPTTAIALKCNSSYQIGIRFRDDSKRESFVVTNINCILNVTDKTFSTSPYNNLLWTLSNASATIEIPDWAYYYDILVTKNLRTRFFIQSIANLQYAKKLADGTFTYQSTYDTSVYAIAVDMSFANSVGLGYVFNEGDQCRLYLGNTATKYEFNIIGQDANYVLIRAENIGGLNPQPGCEFEIYTPYKASNSETFYTTGQSYKITNPTTISRQYSTLTNTISGDVLRFKFLGQHLESMSPTYNMWQDWFQFYGEENIQSLLGQVVKENFVNWSNVKVIGAASNGLSTFDSFDEKALPAEIGAIQKLQLTNKISDLGQGNIMLAICPTETASLYLGETQVQGASQTAYIAQSTSVIGSVNVLNGSRGTVNPETITAIWGLVFGFDINNGVLWQYSPNGLEDVSKYGMIRFFKNYAKDYIAASTGSLDNINGFHHIPFGVDTFHKELICGMPGLIYENYATTLPSYSSVPLYATSIINRFDIYDQLAKAMAFKFEENVWGSNYNYGAEWYEYVENKMFGWKNGAMHEHNTNTTNWNTFYDVQQPVRICLTGNLNPSALKVLNNIVAESNSIPNFTVAYTDWPNIQITDLAYDTGTGLNDWTDTGGLYDAVFFKDRLSPNSTGTADEKMYDGDDLTDFAFKVMLEFKAYTSLIFVNFVDIGYSLSRGNKQILNPINK